MPTTELRDRLERWKSNPISFIQEVLCDPETQRPFVLYREQIVFLREAFRLKPEGRMAHTELVFSAGKKSGKTGLAALIVIATAVLLAGQGGEIYCLANDLEQSASRVFRAVVQILEASPLLKDSVDVTTNRIVFRSTGTFIAAVANDYAGFSGSNPTLNVYDELAYYTSEGSRRLWDEGVSSPARRISFRLTVSTAGFDGEPSPLRDLYDRAMKSGTEIAPDLRRDGNFLCYWTHEMRAPWQTAAWVNEMRRTLRPSQFARLIRNEWVSSESTFIPLEEWDACVDPNLQPILAKTSMPVWAGLDLGLKHDSTALITCGWDGDKIRIVHHQIFVPTGGETLDVESTAEAAVLSLRSRYALQAVFFDPWQALSLSQRLTRAGVNMVEWPQTTSNLSLMAGNLLELIKRQQIVCYSSDELRQAVAKTVAIEGSRGWRLGKAKASDRVDPVIALAMAALAAVQAGRPEKYEFVRIPMPDKYANSPLGGINRLPGEGKRQAESRAADEAASHGRWSREAVRRRHGRWAGI
jgi:phage terminase large subunit-like protein